MHHKKAPIGQRHAIHNWEFLSSIERINYPVTLEDLGKIAWQTNDDSFWILKSVSPLIWISMTDVTSSGLETHESATDPHPQYQTQAETDQRYLLASSKGVANGIASLDTSGVILDSQLSTNVVKTSTLSTAILTHESATDPHPQYQTQTETDQRYLLASSKGVANGIASLGPDGKLSSNQIPPISIVNTSVLNSEAEMLASNSQTGDVVVRSDINKSFILRGVNSTIITDWQEILTGSSVTSVNGKTGSVSLSAVDVGASPVVHTHDYISTSMRGALNGVASLDETSKIPDAQIPDSITRDLELTTAINNHTSAVDPHPQYLTQGEGSALYVPILAAGAPNGIAILDSNGHVPELEIPTSIARQVALTGAISSHEASVDPHPQYLIQSEAESLFSVNLRSHLQNDVSNNTTSMSPTGLIITLQPNKTYKLNGLLILQSSVTSAGVGVSLNGPTNIVHGTWTIQIPTSTMVASFLTQNSYLSNQSTTSSPYAGSDFLGYLTGIITTGNNGGELEIYIRTEISGSIAKLMSHSVFSAEVM